MLLLGNKTVNVALLDINKVTGYQINKIVLWLLWNLVYFSYFYWAIFTLIIVIYFTITLYKQIRDCFFTIEIINFFLKLQEVLLYDIFF